MKVKAQRLIVTLLSLTLIILISYWIKFGADQFISYRDQSLAQQNQKAVLTEAKRLDKLCQKGDDRCFAEQLAQLNKNNKLNFTLSVLDQLQQIEPTTRACHLIAHYISQSETEKDPTKWKKLIGQFDPNSCSRGFIHGVLEAHSRLDPGFQLDTTSITQICDYVENQTRKRGGFLQSCSHIMGHILLAYERGDISKSIQICQQLPQEYRFECGSGVFMENETKENLYAEGFGELPRWNKQFTLDQEKICKQYSGDMSDACWEDMGYLYDYLSGNNPQEAYKLCTRALTAQSAIDCYSVAAAVMITATNFNPNLLQYMCTPYEKDNKLYFDCLHTVIYSALTSSLTFKDRLTQFCNSLVDGHIQDCQSFLSEANKTMSSSENKYKTCKSTNNSNSGYCDMSAQL